MEAIGNLLYGFGVALSPENLWYAFLGCLLGTLVGVLPGIGPTAAIAILLPLTTFLPPTGAIIMMAGIYYGSQYGGSTTSILLNTPGEVSSVPTTLDGYALARQGKGGPALAVAAISSFVAGTVGLVGLTLFAPPLAEVALLFGPPEYFALMVLALTVVVNLSGRSLLRGFISAGFGLLLGTVGLDSITGERRLVFGSTDLLGGINFVAVSIGLFAIAEVLASLEAGLKSIAAEKIGRLMPTMAELKQTIGAMLRSTGIGFALGLLPGVSPGMTAFFAYDAERRVSRTPQRFGRGALEGVAAPEGANNSATSGGFVPLIAFGIPPSPALAVLLGALVIYGLQPGPIMFQERPDFVWGVIASMYIGNVMLLILNLPLVSVWARVVEIPYRLLAPLILVFCFIGALSIRNNFFDLSIMLAFGFLGYVMKKLDYPAAPMILTLILGDRLESDLRRSLVLSGGSPTIFMERPVSLVLLLMAVVLTWLSLTRWSTREEVVAAAEAD
jgi:putative tricarboxylic transport membrane protein